MTSTAASVSRPRLAVAAGTLLLIATLVLIDLRRPTPPRTGPPATHVPIEARVIRDARSALAAWAAFASSGDLRDVTGEAWARGPQLRRLYAEAAAVQPSALPYRFELSSAAVLLPVEATARIVRSTVLIRHGDEVTSAHQWDIHMRRTPGAQRWRLWTVHVAGDDQAGGGTGGRRSRSPG